MKNKNKSVKVQKYIETVKKQEAQAGKNKETVSCFDLFDQRAHVLQMAKEREKEARAQAKKAEEAKKKMEAELFRPVQIQKIPFGTGQVVAFDRGLCG